MKYKLVWLVLVCLYGLFGINPVSGGAVTELPKTRVYVNDRVVPLRSPVIDIDTVLYVPLRDLATPLHARFKKHKKSRTYYLTLPQHTVRVIPYSKEFWVGQVVHFSQYKARLYKNRLYVSVKDIGPALGWDIAHVPNRINIRVGTPSSKEPLFVTSSSETMARRPSFVIDDVDLSKAVSLRLGKKTYDISEYLFLKNGVYFLSIDAIFQRHHYRIDDQPDWRIYDDGHRIIRVSKKQNRIDVVVNGVATVYQTESIPLLQEVWYLPLSVMHSVFNYVVHWDKKRSVLHLLSPITNLEFFEEKGHHYLIITGDHPFLLPQTLKQKKESALVLEIPQSVSLIATTKQWIDHPMVQHVKWTAVNDTMMQLKLTMTAPHHSQVTVSGNVIRVDFFPILTDIRQRILYNDGAEIYLTGSHDLSYQSLFSVSPNQLVLSFDTIHSAVPKHIMSHSHYYHDMRMLEKPFRLVIPLNSEVRPNVLNRTDTHQVVVRFEPKKTTLFTHVAVAETAKTKAPKRSLRKPLRGRVIALDPGHGGSDPGAVGLYGIYEKRYTQDIAKRLTRLLKRAGATVVLVKKNDDNPSLAVRTQLANASQADIFISLHINSFFQSQAYGTETYYYKWKDKKLANALQKSMVKRLRLKDNGVKRGKLYVLNHSTMPAALVEPAFMTNRKEAKLLKQVRFRDKIAVSLYNGIVQYFK